MKRLISTVTILFALVIPLLPSNAQAACLPPGNDIRDIVPEEWIVPGNYNVWNTN